ncbi:MAG TPA: hypothetical protein VIH89_01830 [Candidatus Sulfotelmatobacter sp.]|jgi:hypothetical protein
MQTETNKSNMPPATSRINAKLEKNLAGYMAAAGAAGVGVLALAQPAAAKVVYTAVNVTISPHSAVPLDLNNDGVSDFIISNWFYGHASHLSIVDQAPGNQVFGKNGVNDGPAAALFLGVPIGPKGAFQNNGSMAQQASVSGISSGGDGPWANVTNRYLGLKFSVNGETHYGWARLTVKAKGGVFATLTGYAYETVPNKAIEAGAKSGPVVAEAAIHPQEGAAANPPATLGVLARGSDTLAIWRRDAEVIADDRSDARA